MNGASSLSGFKRRLKLLSSYVDGGAYWAVIYICEVNN
jgi:hypothetical protein